MTQIDKAEQTRGFKVLCVNPLTFFVSGTVGIDSFIGIPDAKFVGQKDTPAAQLWGIAQLEASNVWGLTSENAREELLRGAILAYPFSVTSA